MAKDKRVKGCLQEDCINHIKKKKFKADQDVCPECGSELAFVCRKCFCEIPDIDDKHRVCMDCQKKAIENREKNKKTAIKYAKKAGTVAGNVALEWGPDIAGAVIKGNKKRVVRKLAKKAIKKMVK